MTWWQILLLVWGVGSVPFAFVVARFLRPPAAALPRPHIELTPEHAVLRQHTVELPDPPIEQPEHSAERRDEQVA